MSVCQHDAACPGWGGEHDKAVASQPLNWLAILTSARDAMAEQPMRIHRHIVSPTGKRCIECGEVVVRSRVD